MSEYIGFSKDYIHGILLKRDKQLMEANRILLEMRRVAPNPIHVDWINDYFDRWQKEEKP